MHPCFAEFYPTDKASVGIELSGKRSRGDKFFSWGPERDVVSCITLHNGDTLYANCQAGL